MITGCSNDKTLFVKPPKAKKIEKFLAKHDSIRIDNYYWLREKLNPEVIEHLKAENQYAEKILEPTKKLQNTLFNEITSRIIPNDSTVPYYERGYYYYARYEDSLEYPIYCRKKNSLDSIEQIILDVNELAKGKSYVHVNNLSISPDNKILAYSMDTISRRKYTIYFQNLEDSVLEKDKINNTTGEVEWQNDSRTLYYVTKDPTTLREFKVFKHYLGRDISQDQEVFYEDDETFSLSLSKSKDNRYIFINHQSTQTTEVRYANVVEANPEFKIFQPRETNLEYYLDHCNGKFYIHTNLNGENYHIMTTNDSATTKDMWRPLIKHNENIFIEDFEIFNNNLVLDIKKNGLTQLIIYNLKSKKSHNIDFGEETYTAWIHDNMKYDTDILRFGYSSLTTPNSVFDYDMQTKEKVLLKQQKVSGNFDKNQYVTKRIFATAKDSTKIPISLVHKKGLKLDGNNPVLLYGYGSYGYSIEPYFRHTILSLLDRNFVYAIAHIRGGQEMGYDWYEQGRLLNKKNTFTDFIACSEYLINKKYTNSNNLFAMGGSAGGLLIGAVINMRPDLYKAVIASVPFVDVVTTMLDESIPLTTNEYDEWGNPNKKEYFEYMLSYSPYDNVKKKNYPAILVTTGLHDSQVQYWEPAKWVAKLREYKTNKNPILLITNMNTGHSGESGRFQQYRETALEYAFLLYILNKTE